MEDVNDLSNNATIESSNDKDDETEAAQSSDDKPVPLVG